MPEHLARKAVDVLEELPRQSGFADSCDARDEYEAGRAALGRGVKELLDESQLVVASGEGRLEDARALRAGRRRDDSCRLKQADTLGLALELVVTGVDIGDRRGRGGPRRLVDVAATRRSRRLDTGRGVHPVADDEALLGRLGRGGAAGDDPDSGL